MLSGTILKYPNAQNIWRVGLYLKSRSQTYSTLNNVHFLVANLRATKHSSLLMLFTLGFFFKRSPNYLIFFSLKGIVSSYTSIHVHKSAHATSKTWEGSSLRMKKYTIIDVDDKFRICSWKISQITIASKKFTTTKFSIVSINKMTTTTVINASVYLVKSSKVHTIILEYFSVFGKLYHAKQFKNIWWAKMICVITMLRISFKDFIHIFW